jgi:cyclic pyranopterin phosphate synthase
MTLKNVSPPLADSKSLYSRRHGNPLMGVRQVNITGKNVSFRSATAEGTIRLRPSTLEMVDKKQLEKGDTLTLAQVTGILAAKKTPELLPLCHPLRIDQVDITSEIGRDGITVLATFSAVEKTGVEMEALTSVSIALLNIWDAVKSYEKDKNGQYPQTLIESIRVLKKVKHPVEAL